jgi:hypothetical protein
MPVDEDTGDGVGRQVVEEWAAGTGACDQEPVDAALLDEPFVRLLGARCAEVLGQQDDEASLPGAVERAADDG